MAREGRWRRPRTARREAVGAPGASAAPDPVPDTAADPAGPPSGGASERTEPRRDTEPAGPPADDRTAPVQTLPRPEEDQDEAGDEAGDEEPAEPPFRLRDLTPFLLVRAAHPRHAVLTALGMAVAAALAGRPSRELLLVLGTVLTGQVALGWFNDLVDRRRDARHQRPGKPLADGRLDPGTLWFCLALAVFLVVPLSVANGLYAASAYLASLAVAALGHWSWLRRGFFSWVPWAAAYALYPAFLSYGGWGGEERGAPPELLVTALAALLGVGVHFLTALWGLVPDNADRWTYLPLRLGLRIGASRLLWVSATWTVLVLVGLGFAGTHVGLAQEPLQ